MESVDFEAYNRFLAARGRYLRESGWTPWIDGNHLNRLQSAEGAPIVLWKPPPWIHADRPYMDTETAISWQTNEHAIELKHLGRAIAERERERARKQKKKCLVSLEER